MYENDIHWSDVAVGGQGATGHGSPPSKIHILFLCSLSPHCFRKTRKMWYGAKRFLGYVAKCLVTRVKMSNFGVHCFISSSWLGVAMLWSYEQALFGFIQWPTNSFFPFQFAKKAAACLQIEQMIERDRPRSQKVEVDQQVNALHQLDDEDEVVQQNERDETRTRWRFLNNLFHYVCQTIQQTIAWKK